MRTRRRRFTEDEPRGYTKTQCGYCSRVWAAGAPVALEEVGVGYEEDAIISAAGRKAFQVFFIRKDVAVVLRRVPINLDCPVDLVLDVSATAFLDHLRIFLAQRVRIVPAHQIHEPLFALCLDDRIEDDDQDPWRDCRSTSKCEIGEPGGDA